MNRPLSTLTALLAACVILLACAGDPQTRPAQVGTSVDFTGSWEADYSRSETVVEQYQAMMNQLQREAQRRARQGGNQPAVGVYAMGSGADLYALARMAEIITESQLLEIRQEENEITVKREGNFALHCEFYPGQLHRVETPLGDEICGWDGHQLVFSIALPEGLGIRHRLTLDSRGERLQIATTVTSSQSPYPFTVDKVYRRFDPTADGITCRQTLSRGRVCTTEKTP
jgi:hypothetical protein